MEDNSRLDSTSPGPSGDSALVGEVFAYFDCFSGISGDMVLGSLVDLGVPLAWLSTQLQQLPLDGVVLSESSLKRHGIKGTKVNVQIGENALARNYAEIVSMIQTSSLHDDVKQNSLAVFEVIAAAEAKIHHCPIENVHFHEVGAVDSIVDIVGTALGIHYLNIKKIGCSKIPLGHGFVSCQHGTLPLPAPATVEMLKGMTVYGVAVDRELVTPTGAGIVKGLATSYDKMPEFVIDSIGYGAGSHDFSSHPNMLRVMLGRLPSSSIKMDADVQVIETCIDDMNPEFYGYLMEQLFDGGALDVIFIPVHMKKNRPAVMVQVLCKAPIMKHMIELIFSETTTIGVRTYGVDRYILDRKTVVFETSFGEITFKEIISPRGIRYTPEYEDCKKIASTANIPLQEVYSRLVCEVTNQTCK